MSAYIVDISRDCVLCLRVESSKTIATDKTRKAGETLRLHADVEKPQLVTLFLLLDDMRELGSDVVPGFSPRWDHVIHVVQSRDVPLDPKDVRIRSRIKSKLDYSLLFFGYHTKKNFFQSSYSFIKEKHDE